MQGEVGVGAIEFIQAATDDDFGLLLERKVERGRHLQAAAGESRLAEGCLQLALNVEYKVRGGDGKGGGGVVEGFSSRAFCCFPVDVACLDHQVEYLLLPDARSLRVLDGVVPGGKLRQTSQESALRQVQVTDGFAEVGAGGGLDAGGVVAEVDVVEIQCEDVVLTEASL